MGIKIEKGTRVSVGFKVYDEATGERLSKGGKEKIDYRHGAGEILPALERALEGHEAGDVVKCTIAPSDGFGERNEKIIYRVDRKRFDGIDLYVGREIFLERNKEVRSAIIKEIQPEHVIIDFNHPWAGKTITYSIKVFRVKIIPFQSCKPGVDLKHDLKSN